MRETEGNTAIRVDKSLGIRLLAAGLAVALAAGAGAWWWRARHHQAERGSMLSAADQAQLTSKIVPILEAGLPDAKDGGRLACAAKILGTEPTDAGSPQTVTTAYVWSLCRRLNQPVLSESQEAAVVHLGTPTAVEVPDSTHLSSDIRRLFPKRLQDVANKGAYSDDLEAAAEQRAKELS